jgi:hypothetical protein
MTRFVCMLAVLCTFAVFACSDETVCPGGAIKLSGKCFIEDTGAKADFTIPPAADLQSIDLSVASDAVIDDSMTHENTSQDATAPDAAADTLPLDIPQEDAGIDLLDIGSEHQTDIAFQPDLLAE